MAISKFQNVVFFITILSKTDIFGKTFIESIFFRNTKGNRIYVIWNIMLTTSVPNFKEICQPIFGNPIIQKALKPTHTQFSIKMFGSYM